MRYESALIQYCENLLLPQNSMLCADDRQAMLL